jgi:hypothetical protein
MTASLESELRDLVRDLIKEVLPEVARRSEVRPVRIDDDGNLATFVATVLDLARDEIQAERLRSGGLRFALIRSSASFSAPSAPSAPSAGNGVVSSPDPDSNSRIPRPVLQIDKGAVTERMIAQALADGTAIVLGRGAVLTPLARELARRNDLLLERAR